MGEENNRPNELLKEWIADSNNIVFFGGAGVSTERSLFSLS